jgi:hypothetical protein
MIASGVTKPELGMDEMGREEREKNRKRPRDMCSSLKKTGRTKAQ